MNWTPAQIPPLAGRTYVVTGATAGIGYFAAEQLARSGAEVVLASRSAAKLQRAQDAIHAEVPEAPLRSVQVDLTSLASIAAAAERLAALPRIDGMLLNGAAMDFTRGAQTADGLPLLLGTHVVANFALVARLMPSLAKTADAHGIVSRVVHTSTGFVNLRRYRVDDIAQLPTSGVGAYTKAKTVTETFAFELDRRLRAADVPVASLVVRPGVGVDAKTPERAGIRDAAAPRQRNIFTPLAQGKDTASWSAVRALTDPGATGGDYFSPSGAFKGAPTRIEPVARTRNPGRAAAEAMWRQLEELAGIELAITADAFTPGR